MKHFTFAMSFAAMLVAPAIMHAESESVTAGKVTPQITCGDWTFNCEKADNGYKITSVANAGNDTELDFSNNTAIVAIAADAFSGNTTLTSVVLPKTFTTDGLAKGSLFFSGCTSLKTITVADNTDFTTDHGALYTVENGQKATLVAFPEARLSTEYFRLKSNGNYAYATPTVTNGKGTATSVSNGEVKFADLSTCSMSSLVQLGQAGDSKVKIKFINSDLQANDASLFFAQGNNNIVTCSSTADSYGYTLSANGTDLMVSFSTSANGSLGYAGGELKYLSSANSTMTLEVATSIDVQLNSNGLAMVCLPVDVIVPHKSTKIGIYTVPDASDGAIGLERMTAGGIIIKQEPVLVHGEANQVVTFHFPTDKQWEQLYAPIEGEYLGETYTYTLYDIYNATYTLSYIHGTPNRGYTYTNVFVLDGSEFKYYAEYTATEDNIGVINYYVDENSTVNIDSIKSFTISVVEEGDTDSDNNGNVEEGGNEGEDNSGDVENGDNNGNEDNNGNVEEGGDNENEGNGDAEEGDGEDEDDDEDDGNIPENPKDDADNNLVAKPDETESEEPSTAISEIAAEGADSVVIYDLNGRKVNGALRPGLYINSNGQKFLVK
jgi:hypothetical protein